MASRATSLRVGTRSLRYCGVKAVTSSSSEISPLREGRSDEREDDERAADQASKRVGNQPTNQQTNQQTNYLKVWITKLNSLPWQWIQSSVAGFAGVSTYVLRLQTLKDSCPDFPL